MSVKIFIERKFKGKVDQQTLRIIDEIRMKALKTRGYIGGETVVNVDDHREVMVISALSSVEDWKAWYEKKEWADLEKKSSQNYWTRLGYGPFYIAQILKNSNKN